MAIENTGTGSREEKKSRIFRVSGSEKADGPKYDSLHGFLETPETESKKHEPNVRHGVDRIQRAKNLMGYLSSISLTHAHKILTPELVVKVSVQIDSEAFRPFVLSAILAPHSVVFLKEDTKT